MISHGGAYGVRKSHNLFVWTLPLGKILTIENIIRWGLIVYRLVLYVERFR